jgi:hypothetical protein
MDAVVTLSDMACAREGDRGAPHSGVLFKHQTFGNGSGFVLDGEIHKKGAIADGAVRDQSRLASAGALEWMTGTSSDQSLFLLGLGRRW